MLKITKLAAPFRITEPGAYSMPAAAYHRGACPDAALSQTIAKKIIALSAWHAWVAHPRLNPDFVAEDETKFDLGTAAHTLMLGAGVAVQVCSYPDWRTKEAQQTRAMIRDDGRIPMLAHHHKRTMEMVNLAGEQLTDFKLSYVFKQSGHSELVIAWLEGTCWFQTMIDWVTDDFLEIYDYKTKNESIAPHRAPRIIHNDGWDIQAAMQERALNFVHPEGAGRRKHVFVAQETSPPYALVPYRMSEAHMTMGRKKLQYAADKWALSMKTGMWSGYCDGIIEPRLATWSEKEWLEREVEEFDNSNPPRNVLEAG
jgi:hypothetical protein